MAVNAKNWQELKKPNSLERKPGNLADWVRRFGGGYTHIMTPNKKACVFSNNNADPPGSSISGELGASSYHSGGVNVAMADGSVKFIKDTIALQTWWGLGTRNLGEVISSDAY